ncbi:DUF4837 family protein [Ulvibacter antarcticus]|uniref:Uncharacterized protein DUF4837 n=1 Tax=Ulvibacter antarcticus TaxID=442714 RepID=A0A3L9YZJ7_9FLAO|nr:DUF4837 family protein [Ulvibacter antarcticus]RMA66003.1 uncharacterized protein DUF4837 [Ulvibacter antarcticus]
MKPIFYTLLTVLFLVSCNDGAKKDNSYLPTSLGNINTLQVITPNDLWNGEVGEEIRTYFAAPADGLPQDEPLFSMNQMPPETYTGFARKYRLVLHATLANEDTVILKKDAYSKPQTIAFVTATTKEGLAKLIKENHARMIKAFLNSEIEERQRRTTVSMMKLDSLGEKMGVTMKIPSAYHIAKAEDNFYWIRKELKSGSTNIIVYQVPLNMIGNDSTTVADIIKVRDSIGLKFLPVEDDGVFMTADDYAPYFFTSEIDGKPAFETKGIWQVKDQFMAGPFLNYAIRDEAHNRYLILEGFTYAPSVEKRDLQFELESILKSAKIN